MIVNITINVDGQHEYSCRGIAENLSNDEVKRILIKNCFDQIEQRYYPERYNTLIKALQGNTNEK